MMKVVALISGGKDSCFNMMHCVANGHEIVALANLHPAPYAPDEMDSWMYQTVGHDVVPLYAQAMDLPMYRQIINGTNVETELHYNQSAGDETEDLLQLLVKVKDHHPDVSAVSVGAIASNYQRLRVEHVASRLGLTVLAYMWEQDQSRLLQSMCDSGLVAILIKVAAIGLNTKHLGKTLVKMQPVLMRLHSLYEVHPCGEGGEYESLVLNCPLFKHRLRMCSSDIVELGSDTAHLHLTATLDSSESASIEKHKWLASLYPQQGPAEESTELLKCLQQASNIPASLPTCVPALPTIATSKTVSGAITSSRIVVRDDSPSLAELLPGSNEDILFCTLILRDMGDFAAINTQYGQLWKRAHPPARVCISTKLTNDSGIKAILYTISITQQLANEDETIMPGKRLWVQSRSYWAPSNIGPYSQIAQVRGIAFISGQIGLIPSSMDMPATVEEEICWSMQSLWRIMVSQKVETWSGVVVGYVLDASLADKLRQAFASRFDGKNVRLLIVELQSGSQMPRNAQVEWQTVLSLDPDEVRLQTDSTSRQGLSLTFSTQATPNSSLHWTLPVSKIIHNDHEIEQAAIVICKQ